MIGLSQDPAASQNAVYTEEAFRFLALPELWVLGLVVAPGIALFAWWSYGGLERLEPRTRWLLTCLRGLAIALILLALFQPAWQLTRYSSVQSQVQVLIDDSASMGRIDKYPDEGQRQALSAAAGADASTMRRAELVARVLERQGGLLEVLQKKHDVRLFRFSREPKPIRDLGELSYQGKRTHIGDAMDLLRSSTAVSANLDALILVSDGRNNGGLPPIDIAAKYKLDDVPILTIGVGDPNPPRNARLVGPPGPQEALRREEIAFDVTLSAEGMEGRNATVTLQASRDDGPYLKYETQSAILGRDGEPVKVRLYTAFDDAGDYSLKFQVEPFADETSADDNVATRFLRVNDEKIRVLYLDHVARWEYRYLQVALRRVDPSIEYQAYLFDASKDFPQESSDTLPSLQGLPRTEAELRQYHVVLIGDVPPEKLGATEEQRNAWLEQLVEFVEFGGGVGFLWGERSMPESYRGSPIEDLLPIVLEDRLTLENNRDDWSEGFRPELENPTHPHDIVLLRRDPRKNASLWHDGFEKWHAYYRPQQAKAGAEVILRHPTVQNKYGKLPLLVASYYPRGRTCFIGTDEMWRTRKPYGEKYYDTFWRNVVRNLATGRLRRRNDQVDLRLDKVIVETGERVRVTCQVLDDEYQPTSADEFAVFFRRPDTRPQKRLLRPIAAEPGSYVGTFTMVEPGSTSVMVLANDNPDGRVLAREDVLVKVPDREMSRSSQDAAALREIATASKDGRHVFLADVDQLFEEFERRKPYDQEVDRSTKPLWDSMWTLLAVLLILSVEWILRKRARLV